MLGLAIPRLWIYGALAVALMGAYFYIRIDAYNDGVEDTVKKYETVIQEERERLREANQDALREARDRIAKLSEELRARDATIGNLRKAARADPNADRACLGVDSVRRLNRLR